ncbi:unnamed protein product [Brassica oleracea]
MFCFARETIDRSANPEKRFCVFWQALGLCLVTLMF